MGEGRVIGGAGGFSGIDSVETTMRFDGNWRSSNRSDTGLSLVTVSGRGRLSSMSDVATGYSDSLPPSSWASTGR